MRVASRVYSEVFAHNAAAHGTLVLQVYLALDRWKPTSVRSAEASFLQATRTLSPWLKFHSNWKTLLFEWAALRKYRHYLEAGKFTLRTHNRALTWLDNIKDGKGKLHRWTMYLKSFNFSVQHVAGKNNELPDTWTTDLKYSLTTRIY